MADTLANGAPPTSGAAFTFRGRDYLLPPVTQRVKQDFSAWCAAQALRNVRALEALVRAGQYTAQEQAADYDLAQTRVQAGYFWFDEPGGVTARCTREGLVYLCWLCLKAGDPNLSLGAVREMAEADGGLLLSEQYVLANANPTAPPR